MTRRQEKVRENAGGREKERERVSTIIFILLSGPFLPIVLGLGTTTPLTFASLGDISI